MAFLITVVVAVPAGIASAVKQDTWIDYSGRRVAFNLFSDAPRDMLDPQLRRS